jgi:cell division protein ZapB
MPEGVHAPLDLAALEARVDELARRIAQMSHENETLRTQHLQLVNERAQLIQKTELARSRVEAMIIRLKALETRS